MSDLPKAESPAGGPRERMHVPFIAVAPVCRRRRRVPGGPNFQRDIGSRADGAEGAGPANERAAHWRKPRREGARERPNFYRDVEQGRRRRRRRPCLMSEVKTFSRVKID